jgi:hypothetical protein
LGTELCVCFSTVGANEANHWHHRLLRARQRLADKAAIESAAAGCSRTRSRNELRPSAEPRPDRTRAFDN